MRSSVHQSRLDIIVLEESKLPSEMDAVLEIMHVEEGSKSEIKMESVLY